MAIVAGGFRGGTFFDGGGEVPTQQRIHELELPVRVGDGIERVQHVKRVFRGGRQGGVEVEGPEAEPPREPEHRLVVRIDQLPAPLADLPVLPVVRPV